MRYPNIDAERARRGLTYDELAQELGVCRKTLYNWVHVGNIPAGSVQKLTRVFNCSADYLLGMDMKPKTASQYVSLSKEAPQ